MDENRRLLVFGVLIFFLASAGIYFFPRYSFSLNHQSEEMSTQLEATATEVVVVSVKGEPLTVAEELPGRTVAYKIAEVRPQISGIVTERLFEPGSDVYAGQQLYQIEEAPYQAAYESAVADLRKARANIQSLEAQVRRYRELVTLDAVSKQELDDVEADLEQALADVDIAKAAVTNANINLQYTKVYAPISGRIGRSTVTQGALVIANQSDYLTTITQLDPIYVDITQPSSALMRLKKERSNLENTPITLALEGDDKNYDHIGKLQFHEVAVDATTGSVQWRTLFPNPDQELLPGLFVRAQMQLGYSNVMLIPQKSAQRKPDGSLSVWTVDQQHIATQKKIVVRQALGDKWWVEQGLEDGDLLITEGSAFLQEGRLTRPILQSDALQELKPSLGG